MPAAHKQADRKVFFGLARGQNKHLLDAGHTCQSNGAKATVVHRHFPPAHDFQALFGQSSLNCSPPGSSFGVRSEEHTSELQSRPHLVCRLLLEKKKKNKITSQT